MFQFRRFPTYAYFVQRTLTEYCSAGFPHSEIPGSMPMCGSPRLIAACHVLLRLSMPRHSPCALISLTSSKQSPFRSEHPLGYSSLHPLASPLPREPACAGLRSDRFWFSSRIMQASDSVHCSFVLPFLKVHKSLLCYLSVACSQFLACIHCSVFKVQTSDPFQDQIEMLGRLPKHFNLFLVEVTGLEPVTPCLQSKCSTS